ncbi:MAG: hypothetical protein GMKNLPBB_01796 [Myxococcota bacterium]|nr:hypothetical protein [Myxococcota bacterium]
MKRFRLSACILLAILLPPAARADSPAEDLLSRAAIAQKQGRLDEALALWAAAEKPGKLDATGHYNRSLIHGLRREHGLQRLHLLRALWLDPELEPAQNALNSLEQELGNETVWMAHCADESDTVALWRALGPTAAQDAPLLLLLAGLWTASGALGFRLTRRGQQHAVRTWVIAGAGVLMAAAGAGPPIAHWWWTSHNPHGVIVHGPAALHQEANPASPVLARLPAGCAADILEPESGWVRLRFTSGLQGWMPARNIERLLPPRS